MHEKDEAGLKAVKKSLGVGRSYRHGLNSIQLKVQSLKELEVVLNHFKKFKLITKKRADFELLGEILNLIKRGEHLTPEGLRKLVAIRAAMNLGLSEKLHLAFADVVPVDKPKVELPQKIEP